MSLFALSKSKILPPVVLMGALALSGCDASSIFLNQNFGLASGAAVGKSVLKTTTIVDDQPPTEAITALNGGVVGKAVGNKLSNNERQQALKAEFEALEYSPAGQPVKWGVSSFGNSGIVTASKTYDVGSSNCRQYVHILKVAGKTETARGTACKEQDGNWIPLT